MNPSKTTSADQNSLTIQVTQEPETLREKINNLQERLYFLYALHVANMQKGETQKTGKQEKQLGKLRTIRLHIQTSTLLLQNFKHIDKKAGIPLQMIWDSIAYLPYPASYVLGKDLMSSREITKKDLSEVFMLLSSLWANVMSYFIITGQRHIVGILAVHNKTTFRVSQALKAKNSHWWPDQDHARLLHDKEL
jgi:hypothetical protein